MSSFRDDVFEIGVRCTKCVVFVFNVAFALIGITIAAIGVIIHTRVNDYATFFDKDWFLFPIVAIVNGVIIFIIAFLGFCGSLKESKCMIFSFSVIMILVLLIEVGLGIAAYERRDLVEDAVEFTLTETLNSMKNDDILHMKMTAWNKLQNDFKCCGVNSVYDWDIVGSKLPSSCCQFSEGARCNISNAASLGCKIALSEFWSKHLSILAAAGIGFAIFQFIGIVFGCCHYSVFRGSSNNSVS